MNIINLYLHQMKQYLSKTIFLVLISLNIAIGTLDSVVEELSCKSVTSGSELHLVGNISVAVNRFNAVHCICACMNICTCE